jgi:hypothetical protein
VDPFGGLVDIVFLGGPGGKVYEDSFSGPWIWYVGFPNGFGGVLSSQLPNSDDPKIQLVRGGGTYRLRLATSSFGPELFLHVVIEQRSRGSVNRGRLPVNVFIAEGIPLDGGSAPSDPKLTGALQTMDTILGKVGLRIGEVSYHKLTDPFWNDIDSVFAFEDMLANGPFSSTPPPPEGRLNLYFVNSLGGDFDTAIGVSGALPGFKVDYTPYSGVVMEYDGQPTFTLGSTCAHEVGHFLGLLHTVEWDGTPDLILDTLWCLPSGTDEICPVEGADYLMHWFDLGMDGTRVTLGQGHVMLRNAIVEPGLPDAFYGAGSGAAPVHVPEAVALALLEGGMPHRCANCAGIYPAERHE